MSERDAEPRPRSPVDLFVYADYACPYSYIGTRRLLELAADYPLTVHWRPLPPATGPSVAGTAAALAPGETRELMRQAAALGLPLALPIAPVDTRRAHQAAELGRDLGGEVFQRAREALFFACLAEGRDLGDLSVLLAVVERAGLDRAAVEAALEDGRYEEELEAARSEAERYEITATPTFLFGRLKLVGAAPVEEMRQVAARAATEANPG